MSEPKWTKGPWYVRTEDDDWGCDTFVETMDDVLFDVRPAKGPSWQMANARLIAAAPDLYDALQRLLRFVAEHTASGEVVPAHTVEHVRTYAALAKARGEA